MTVNLLIFEASPTFKPSYSLGYLLINSFNDSLFIFFAWQHVIQHNIANEMLRRLNTETVRTADAKVAFYIVSILIS